MIFLISAGIIPRSLLRKFDETMPSRYLEACFEERSFRFTLAIIFLLTPGLIREILFCRNHRQNGPCY